MTAKENTYRGYGYGTIEHVQYVGHGRASAMCVT